ncbi:MAG: serine hydrolase [Chitinophagaceae bacterium]|jgi:beta-lactamase class A|nr:serine hydrolase [Chitinophagaceae bacterium]
MITKTIFYLAILLAPHLLFAQKSDKALQKKIELALAGFNGDVGIYVKNLKNGKMAAVNADIIFPTASIVKVPIMIGVMDKIEKGELTYDQELIYKDSLLYEGEDILGSFKEGEKIRLNKVMMLMLTMSDNTASLWLQSLAGTGIEINKKMEELGMKSTRVNSRTPNRESDWRKYGWGQTTPREMATLLEMILNNQVISPAASTRMARNLGRNFWDDVALSEIPPYEKVLSKNGAVNASRSEVLLVTGKESQYVYCITTKNIKDESWEYNNEAWVLQRNIAMILWKHFEPKSKWTKPAGGEKFN